MPLVFCTVCDGERPSAKSEPLQNWIHKLPAALTVSRDAFKTAAVCKKCCEYLRNPYLIYDSSSKSDLEVLHITSRAIRIGRKRVKGLLALKDLPANLAFPYCGLLVDEFALNTIELESNIRISREYAKAGPKDRGVSTALLGQLTPAGPYNCAHFVNCIYKTKLKPNARWGTIKVDREFLERYPDLSARLGDMFPAFRLTSNVAPGEEILLQTYGAGYWLSSNADKDKNSIKVRSLPPNLKRKLEQANESSSRAKRAKRK